jgi:hypothetical protein
MTISPVLEIAKWMVRRDGWKKVRLTTKALDDTREVPWIGRLKK